MKLMWIALGIWSVTPFAFGQSATKKTEDLINYEDLSHRITLTALRAGNHDASGINDYYFAATVMALRSSTEERQKPLEARQKIEVPAGEFNKIQIKALSFWRPSGEQDTAGLVIPGETLRELTSRAMREWQVGENDVGIAVLVKMFEREKLFEFFGEDLLVGKASYFVIPDTYPHSPARELAPLAIADDRGTSVQLTIRYTKGDAPEGANENQASR